MKHSDGIGSTFGVLLNLRMTSDPSLSVQKDSSPMKTAQSIDKAFQFHELKSTIKTKLTTCLGFGEIDLQMFYF